MKPQFLIPSILILQLAAPVFAQDNLGQSEWQTPAASDSGAAPANGQLGQSDWQGGGQSATAAEAQSNMGAGAQPQLEQSNLTQPYSSGNESTSPAQLGQSQ